MVSLIPELLVNTHDLCGENPLWDDRRSVLYWIDIPHGELYEYNPQSRSHRLVWQGEECGAFTLQEDGRLLLLFQGTMAMLQPETGLLTPCGGQVSRDTGRFNDCIADETGRIFAGTVDGKNLLRGAIIRIDTDGSPQELWRGTNCANGWALTPDGDTLYFSDTTARHVISYRHVATDGALLDKHIRLETGHMNDGMTIDREGNLWVAIWDEHCLRHYSPQAELLAEVSFPAQHITSCIFGGANLDELYVTSAGGSNEDNSQTGALFRLRPKIGGTREHRSRLFT